MIPNENLPDFEKPPVVEVALSVQFDPIERLQAPQMGLFWATQRERFPHAEQHPEIEPVTERFDLHERPALRVFTAEQPPTPRLWLLNDIRTELIQLQRNKFVRNWREVPGHTEPYPRYKRIRQRFVDDYNAFKRFLEDENLGNLVPQQCEITYVNHILAGAGWEKHSEIDKVLTVWSGKHSDSFLPAIEDAVIAFRYVIAGERGEKIGRLNVKLQPAYSRKDNRPIFILSLTARGKPRGVDDISVMELLDLGHRWIVIGFTSMTTSTMHEIWRRKDA